MRKRIDFEIFTRIPNRFTSSSLIHCFMLNTASFVRGIKKKTLGDRNPLASMNIELCSKIKFIPESNVSSVKTST